MIRFIRLNALLLILTQLFGCAHRTGTHFVPHESQPHVSLHEPQHQADSQQLVHSKGKHTIVVFIHGATTFVPSWTSFVQAWRSSHADSEQSFYEHYQEKTRFCGYRQKQPIGIKGLCQIDCSMPQKATDYVRQHTKKTRTIAQLYHNVHSRIYGNHHDFSFYTFGWAGSLSVSCRQAWGETLYHALSNRLHELQRSGKYEHIRLVIIAHSHGGNVALHLAEAHQKHGNPLAIDLLILLGTPIQSETSNLIHSPIFKKIYNIYSMGDWVQKIDCISTQDGFSRRSFGPKQKEKPDIKLPAHLREIEVCVNDYAPSHSELWYFGGILHFFYRIKFPLYPYPLSIFLPCVERIVEQLPETCKHLKLHIHRTGPHFKFAVFNKHTSKLIPEIYTATLDL